MTAPKTRARRSGSTEPQPNRSASTYPVEDAASLLDWPAFHERARRFVEQTLRRNIERASPIATRVRRITIHEGRAIEILYPNGERQRLEPDVHEASIT